MTFKYLVHACTLVLVGGSCTVAAPAPASPSASAPREAIASPGASPTAGLVVPVAAAIVERAWYTLPDPVFHDAAVVTVEFAADAAGVLPRVRLEPGSRDVALAPTARPGRWTARVDLSGLAPGRYAVSVVERVAGADVPVRRAPSATFVLSAPEYVVWTLDFEGDDASDATMANTAQVADGLRVPMTVLWNPRAWTSGAVAAARGDAMLAWTKGRAARGDEVGLHLHMWTDYVRAAGVAPRLAPSWAGRDDGYDVPMTAYTEDEQRALIAFGLRLMGEHGIGPVTSFRAGGDFGDAATLRALAASGITADCTAVPAGTFGALRWPWTLPAGAQPYHPARDDANRPGDLPLLEAPTNGGNTFGRSPASIGSLARADLGLLAGAGEAAAERRALVVVSHPGTIDAVERAAIESLFGAFDPLRYDRDAGPLRFVTLAQLAQAWR